MKNMLKKLTLSFLGMFGVVLATSGSLALANSTSTFNPQGFTTAGAGKDTGFMGADQEAGDGIIAVIKKGINWLLGMLSIITLVILLYGGFNMVTAAGDESKYKKGFTILKQAGVGLAFIALSWLIVSLIFFVIRGASGAQ